MPRSDLRGRVAGGAADDLLRLDERDRLAGLLQQRRGRDPRDACADDRNVDREIACERLKAGAGGRGDPERRWLAG
jgi:hypothetical protein